MLDTDQLRSFLAIVDCGSFTKAAERVHKTQSAVSMHIRRLEEQLGCALFVKQGRGAKLTAEGESLIDFARRIIQVEAGAVAALSRKGLRGSVRLGIPDDYAESFLAEVLARFNRRHPLVEVSATCENSQDLAAQISAGALELALVTHYDGMNNFELLREEPLVWAAAERFRIELGQPVPLALGSGACVWRRAADEALVAAPRATRGLLLLQEFQRDRFGGAGRTRRHAPAGLDGCGRSAGRRAGHGLAGAAADQDGPHPRAGSPDGGNESVRGRDPDHHRRPCSPGGVK